MVKVEGSGGHPEERLGFAAGRRDCVINTIPLLTPETVAFRITSFGAAGKSQRHPIKDALAPRFARRAA